MNFSRFSTVKLEATQKFGGMRDEELINQCVQYGMKLTLDRETMIHHLTKIHVYQNMTLIRGKLKYDSLTAKFINRRKLKG